MLALFLVFEGISILFYIGLPWWLGSKESACNAEAAGDAGSNPVSGTFPGGGPRNPFQYSCLEKPMNRKAWRYSPWGHTESDMSEAA